MLMSDLKKWVERPKGKYCIKCTLEHCPEVGVDYTVGCCICFAEQEKKDGKKPIAPCYECEMQNEYCNHSFWEFE